MSHDQSFSFPGGQKFVPVCAIGASAGGVAALQSLFKRLPSDLGLAYVVILHLSPDEPSSLDEVLSSCTRMPVHQIEDAPTLKPDCVFVIPPDRELVIDGDTIAARPFSEPRGKRAPIDMFFRSVAVVRGDGVAIVLSGAGSDGALGVAAIKEAGGVILVQEPAEATFSSMPQSAIATGVADFVAPISRLAERLAEVARSKEAVRSLDMAGAANDLRRIVALLRSRTGHDFSAYKRATVMRRVIRRMQVCRTDTLADYADYLLTTPEEAKNLFSDLLISVTTFFRDEHAFEALARQAIKPLVEGIDEAADETIRVWVVGCATGEEAYSIAILLHEELVKHSVKAPFQIFATDLDEAALATAREGRYPRAIEADVTEERLARFFINEGTHFRVRKELRESVLFAKHSILKEPPFMRLDLITCRNLLIYLERSLQAQVCSISIMASSPAVTCFWARPRRSMWRRTCSHRSIARLESTALARMLAISFRSFRNSLPPSKSPIPNAPRRLARKERRFPRRFMLPHSNTMLPRVSLWMTRRPCCICHRPRGGLSFTPRVRSRKFYRPSSGPSCASICEWR